MIFVLGVLASLNNVWVLLDNVWVLLDSVSASLLLLVVKWWCYMDFRADILRFFVI